jgi:hypothetical protein
MSVLRMRDAVFARGSEILAGPVSCEIDDGERKSLFFISALEAGIVAMLASACAKATGGSVFIGEFDPRIQPAQSKRIVGYVPHELTPSIFPSFEGYVAYRAALWSLDRSQALADALELASRLEGVHESFAYPLIGALLAKPRLLVLDRPQAVYAAQILDVAGERAVLSTHASLREAEAFG